MVLIAELNSWQGPGLHQIKYREEVVDFSMSTFSGPLASLTALMNRHEERKNGQGWGRILQ